MKKIRVPDEECCYRCGHKWIPRQKVLRICPKCKSPYFDLPRKKKK